MRGYRLSPDDVLRRAVIGRLSCHTIIPKHEVQAEFGIIFDEYFAAELLRLETVRQEGLVVLSRDDIRVTPLGRIFHPQHCHDFRPLPPGAANGSAPAVFEDPLIGETMADSKHVIVIGAGISGLACAYRLNQMGAEATLLEASNRPAGLIGTVQKDGFLLSPAPKVSKPPTCFSV